MKVEELVELRRVEAVAPSPDGRWLAVQAQRHDTEKGKYVNDLWRVPTDGGPPLQLTSGEHDDTSPRFRWDGALTFLSTRPTPEDSEGKRAQVWIFRPEGGDPIVVTDEPLGVRSFAVARTTDVMVVETSRLPDVSSWEDQRETVKERGEKGPTARRYTRMPVRFWDHWLPNSEPHFVLYADGEREPWFGGRHYRNSGTSLSADGSRFAVSRELKQGADRLWDRGIEVWNVASRKEDALYAEADVWIGSPVLSDDGSSLFANRTEREGTHVPRTEVVAWEVEDDAHAMRTVVAEPEDELSVAEVSPDGTELLATGALRGATPVFSVRVDDGAVTRITSEEAGGSHSGVSFASLDGETSIVGVRSGLLQAPEPFRCAWKAGSEPRLLDGVSGWDAPEGVRVDDAWADSTDGAEIHHFVVGPDDETPRPTLIWIHGGPISAWADVWHWRWNSLVAIDAGYRVVLPNPRGSTGYGYDFVDGIWGNVWGAQCYEDLMAVTDAVEARAEVRADALVAMGGSFGGYMTNWIGGMTDRFACLVSHAGIASFETFHGITDNPAWWSLMFGMEPFEDLEELRVYSPIAKIDAWSSPVLVIHGQQDYRVPVGEALLLFEALQKYGVDSELLVYPDENHWILRPRNVESWYREVLAFIERHV